MAVSTSNGSGYTYSNGTASYSIPGSQSISAAAQGNTLTGTVSIGNAYNWNNITNANQQAYNVAGTSWTNTSYPVSMNTSGNTIITIHSATDVMVKVMSDGRIEWNQNYTVDDAARQFSQMLQMSTELACGITTKVKCEIRDSIFEEIIYICDKRGTITADDLRFMHESCKIVDKLKAKY
jgi:hypothetical protein